MAKLAIDRASIVSCKKNREIFIPNREIGRFSLFYQKSGDLPQNRETWKLWDYTERIYSRIRNHVHCKRSEKQRFVIRDPIHGFDLNSAPNTGIDLYLTIETFVLTTVCIVASSHEDV